ncbi:MAG: hypothetical protein AMXMBFR58_36520 [Phycisphaerae bacterium]
MNPKCTHTGSCTLDDIAAAVRRRASAIRACYEQRLQVNPKLSGQVSVRWAIGTDGRVADAALASSTVADAKIGDCVVRVVKRIVHAKPQTGTCDVTWSFEFSPAK